MNWLRGCSFLAAGVLWLAVSAGCSNAETVEIPLNQIWALDMPGTLDVNQLNSGLAWEIQKEVGFGSEDENAKPGFAVLGTGLESLRSAHAVLAKGNKPRNTFPQGSNVSAVFFTTEVSSYVHFDRVERKGNVVNIRYRFVPHESEDTSRHLALIPLGKLPSGEYRVNVIQSPMEQAYATKGFQPIRNKDACRVVCNSFSFSILEQGK